MTAPLPQRKPLYDRTLAAHAAELAVISGELAGLPSLTGCDITGDWFPVLSFSSEADALAWQRHGELSLLVEVWATKTERVRYAQLWPSSTQSAHWMVEVRYPADAANREEPVPVDARTAAFWAKPAPVEVTP